MFTPFSFYMPLKIWLCDTSSMQLPEFLLKCVTAKWQALHRCPWRHTEVRMWIQNLWSDWDLLCQKGLSPFALVVVLPISPHFWGHVHRNHLVYLQGNRCGSTNHCKSVFYWAWPLGLVFFQIMIFPITVWEESELCLELKYDLFYLAYLLNVNNRFILLIDD